MSGGKTGFPDHTGKDTDINPLHKTTMVAPGSQEPCGSAVNISWEWWNKAIRCDNMICDI